MIFLAFVNYLMILNVLLFYYYSYRYYILYLINMFLDQVTSPPPAPPIMPPTYLSNTIRRKVDSHVNLPMLNWTPMYSVRNTLFEVRNI